MQKRISFVICWLSILGFTSLLSSCSTIEVNKLQNERFGFLKWKKAVIQLECATDSKSIDEISHLELNLLDSLEMGKISRKEYIEKIIDISDKRRDIRFQGTAIFLKYNDRHYLITARHVLFDEISAERDWAVAEKKLLALPPDARRISLEYAIRNKENQIFNIIFRVSSINEISAGPDITDNNFLMNLGAGPIDMCPYTFSNPDIDLAIISLDQRNKNFVNKMLSIGYEAINLDDITDAPSSEGVNIFTVGYPSFSAFKTNMDETFTHWASGFVSVPNFAFGKVSMLHDSLYFFWCDLSVYPGFSGSPIVENDKLVGIVSQQKSIPVDKVVKNNNRFNLIPDPSIQVRIPFGQIIKSKYVKSLLEEQIKKDNNTYRK